MQRQRVLGGSVSNGGTEAYVRIKEKRPACFRGRDEGLVWRVTRARRCRWSTAGRISRRLHGG